MSLEQLVTGFLSEITVCLYEIFYALVLNPPVLKMKGNVLKKISRKDFRPFCNEAIDTSLRMH